MASTTRSTIKTRSENAVHRRHGLIWTSVFQASHPTQVRHTGARTSHQGLVN